MRYQTDHGQEADCNSEGWRVIDRLTRQRDAADKDRLKMQTQVAGLKRRIADLKNTNTRLIAALKRKPL